MAPKHIDETVEELAQWRAEHPVRANGGAGPNWRVSVTPRRPPKWTQEPWCSYTADKDKQAWFYVPFLCERGEGSTEPLAGAPLEAALQQVVYQGQNFEHYSNIHRIQHLASGHPLVAQVVPHRVHRDPPSAFNSIGRCVAFHPSPWDLKLTLAASGATMYVGFTVNAVRDDLACMWWRPGSGLQDVTEYFKARAVFFDIAEAEHQQPPLRWRQAWDRLVRFLLLNARTAVEAAGELEEQSGGGLPLDATLPRGELELCPADNLMAVEMAASADSLWREL